MSTSSPPPAVPSDPRGQRRAGAGGYHHGDLQQALLQAAHDIAHELGSASLTLRAVARRAGVSHTAAYNHFDDKDDLLRALAIKAFERLGVASRATLRAPDATVEDVALTYLRFGLANPVEFRFMFDRSLCMPEGEPDPLKSASLEALRVLRDALVEWQRSGALRDGDPDTLALAVWTQMHGITTIAVESPTFVGVPQPQIEELTRSVVRALIHGIGAA